MGPNSRLLVTITLLFFLPSVIACREGPFAIPTPTPSFKKTFQVVEEPLPDAGENQVPAAPITAPTTVATEPPAAAGAAAAGKKLFDANCNMCHPSGGKGMGPSLIDGKTTGQSFKQAVRGGKGAMPPYGIDRISDSDLEAMWSYVKDLK